MLFPSVLLIRRWRALWFAYVWLAMVQRSTARPLYPTVRLPSESPGGYAADCADDATVAGGAVA